MHTLRWVTLGGLLAAMACGGSSPTSNLNQTPPPPHGSVVDVSIQDYSFSPATLTIAAGTTVRWINNGPAPHSTTSDAGVWDSKTLAPPGTGTGDPYGNGGGSTPGATFEYTFSQPGTYSYHCSIHPPSAYPDFKGTITVTP